MAAKRENRRADASTLGGSADAELAVTSETLCSRTVEAVDRCSDHWPSALANQSRELIREYRLPGSVRPINTHPKRMRGRCAADPIRQPIQQVLAVRHHLDQPSLAQGARSKSPSSRTLRVGISRQFPWQRSSEFIVVPTLGPDHVAAGDGR
jgi:hypothetical protein